MNASETLFKQFYEILEVGFRYLLVSFRWRDIYSLLSSLSEFSQSKKLKDLFPPQQIKEFEYESEEKKNQLIKLLKGNDNLSSLPYSDQKLSMFLLLSFFFQSCHSYFILMGNCQKKTLIYASNDFQTHSTPFLDDLNELRKSKGSKNHI